MLKSDSSTSESDGEDAVSESGAFCDSDSTCAAMGVHAPDPVEAAVAIDVPAQAVAAQLQESLKRNSAEKSAIHFWEVYQKVSLPKDRDSALESSSDSSTQRSQPQKQRLTTFVGSIGLS